jgi:hypothetical protein
MIFPPDHCLRPTVVPVAKPARGCLLEVIREKRLGPGNLCLNRRIEPSGGRYK